MFILHNKKTRKSRKFNPRSTDDMHKIVFSKVNKNGDSNLGSVNSSNQSHNEYKKEEILNYISNKKDSNSEKNLNKNEDKNRKQSEYFEDFHYKTQSRKLYSRLSSYKIDVINKTQLENIDKKMLFMRNKIVLIKGNFDFIYPKIVLKNENEITNKLKKLKVKENVLKCEKFLPQKEIFVDNLPLHIKNFKNLFNNEKFSKSLQRNKSVASGKQFFSNKN